MTKEDLLHELKSLRMSCNAFYQSMIDRIRDLESENAELKELHESDKKSLALIVEKGAKLEKENAELEKSVTMFSKGGLDFLHSIKSNRNCIDCESKMSIQLTKAKEKIRNLLEIIERPYQFNAPEKIQMVKEAEQFLSEVEK